MMHMAAHGPMPMSKPSKGKVDHKSAKGPRATNRKPKGSDPRGIHPMTSATGNKKMNRVGKGVDRSRGRRGVVTPKRTKLDGVYF